MANLLKDIQCVGSDTRPPMLERTDFASWKQRIRLYCQGKENGVNILKSIDEGQFQMGTVREPLTEGTEGAPLLVQDGRVVVQNVQGQQNRGQGTTPRGGGTAGHIARNCTQPKRPQNSNYFKDKMMLMQAQENRVALDKEQLFFLADDFVAFDFDVDEAPTAQTMFMANLSSADPVYDEAGLSYDLDNLSECNLPGSGISFLLVVGNIFTSSGIFFWQWEFLMHFIPNNPPLNLMLLL
uniref:Retrovirus-related Pol polyprotein from transposon TNT 1-94 n=1 Tax=Tanacetum cinerariifolium TaxID=118510 RepID=A0A699H495_TANCI|nr:retrovirus-related Pol polyprotein from transposon TNT 1-94 [Tanacetum cinerariifolium]